MLAEDGCRCRSGLRPIRPLARAVPNWDDSLLLAEVRIKTPKMKNTTHDNNTFTFGPVVPANSTHL